MASAALPLDELERDALTEPVNRAAQLVGMPGHPKAISLARAPDLRGLLAKYIQRAVARSRRGQLTLHM